MLSRLQGLGGRLRSSFFFIPMLCVIGAVVLGEVMLLLDALVPGIDPRLTATVDSARTVLTTVASATLAFAGIAFSVSLLLISLASSQFSPRVVHGMFRDPFNKRVMGLVIGTFTYCLVVLRAVRSSLGSDGEAIVPSISILLAVALGTASVLSIVAFINHAAHSMDVSKILRRVTEEALDQAAAAWPVPEPDADAPVGRGELPRAPHDAVVVRFSDHGWVQNVDYDRLLAVLPEGSTMWLDTFAGRYAIPNTPVCRVWPAPADDDLGAAIRKAVMVGETRTLQQDLAYGVRQLADVALKAMSPGINDPTTAHDAMSHLGTVLADLLRRVPPAQRVSGPENRTLLVRHATTYEQLVGLAFDELRIVCAEQPTVLVYLQDVLHDVEMAISHLHRPAAVEALHRQAALILSMNEEASVPEADRERVRRAHAAVDQG